VTELVNPSPGREGPLKSRAALFKYGAARAEAHRKYFVIVELTPILKPQEIVRVGVDVYQPVGFLYVCFRQETAATLLLDQLDHMVQ